MSLIKMSALTVSGLTTTHRCAILVHRMRQFMIFRILAEEEARLAHVKVEAFQTAITEANDRILFANVTLRLMSRILAGEHSMHDRKPHQTLRLMLQPAEKMLRLNRRFEQLTRLINASELKARSHRRLNV